MWFRSFGCLLARKMGRKVKSELCELCFSKFRNASDSGGDNAAVYTAVYWDSQFEKHTVWSFRSSPNWSICFQNLVEFLPIQQAPLLREDSISRLFQKEYSKSLGRFPKTTELVFFRGLFQFLNKTLAPFVHENLNFELISVERCLLSRLYEFWMLWISKVWKKLPVDCC